MVADSGRRRAGTLTPLQLVHFFYYLAVFSASFDIFLTFDIGFNVRAAQLLWLFPIVYALLLVSLKGTFIKPLGFPLLLVWTGFILLFIPNSHFYARGLGYGVWLVYSAALVFTTVQLFTTRKNVLRLLRVYLYSFFFVACFGLVQFLLGVSGIDVLVDQWWIKDRLPRVNGFSYEPSFFATYLLTGWVFVAWLVQTKSTFVRPGVKPRWRLYLVFSVLTLAMVLSSSRIGLLLMALYLAQYPVRLLLNFFRGRLNLRYAGYLTVVLVVAAAAVTAVFATNTERLFLFGTGLGGTPSSSASIRLQDLSDTLRVFSQSPLVGYSLGGVAPAIAELRGVEVTSLDVAQQNEGISVFAEVLAASGAFGFVPFILYFGWLLGYPLRLVRTLADGPFRSLLGALIVSFLFLLLALQFNQNILRLYFWLHVAVICAVYAVARREGVRREG